MTLLQTILVGTSVSLLCEAFITPPNAEPDVYPRGSYALPTISLEEAKADPEQLTGTFTIAYYLNDKCEGNAVVSKTQPAPGYALSAPEVLSENPLDNLLCFAEPQMLDNCEVKRQFAGYMTDEGVQLFETDDRGEITYPFIQYGECVQTRVYGEGVYGTVSKDGAVVPVTPIDPAHDQYTLSDATLDEVLVDPTLHTGLYTYVTYATPDCSGRVVATEPAPPAGYQLYLPVPPVEDNEENLYCLIDESGPTCQPIAAISFGYHVDSDTHAIIRGDEVTEFTYGECNEQLGGLSWKVYEGGQALP